MTAAWSHKGSSTLYGLWLPRCYFLSWSTVILGTEKLQVGKDTSIFVGQTETHPWCVFQTLVHTSMNWEYPWPPHIIWHQHIKDVQLYTPVHSSYLDHTLKVWSHLYLLPVTLWLISEFGCMVTLFASSAHFKGNCCYSLWMSWSDVHTAGKRVGQGLYCTEPSLPLSWR